MRHCGRHGTQNGEVVRRGGMSQCSQRRLLSCMPCKCRWCEPAQLAQLYLNTHQGIPCVQPSGKHLTW